MITPRLKSDLIDIDLIRYEKIRQINIDPYSADWDFPRSWWLTGKQRNYLDAMSNHLINTQSQVDYQQIVYEMQRKTIKDLKKKLKGKK